MMPKIMQLWLLWPRRRRGILVGILCPLLGVGLWLLYHSDNHSFRNSGSPAIGTPRQLFASNGSVTTAVVTMSPPGVHIVILEPGSPDADRVARTEPSAHAAAQITVCGIPLWAVVLIVALSSVCFCICLRQVLMARLGGPARLQFFTLKMAFRIQVVLTALFSISDVALDWSSFSSFVMLTLNVFACMALLLLIIPPLLCYAFERASNTATLSPVSYILQLHMIYGALDSITLGRKVFGMVWAAICEISLEAYYNTMLQSYAVLIAPKTFLQKEYSYVLIHVSVIMALMNMGKVLALDLDFYGQNRPKHRAQDDIRCRIWEGDSKSELTKDVRVLTVKEYAYEVAIKKSLDYQSIDDMKQDVDLSGGSFAPFYVQSCTSGFALAVGVRLASIYETKQYGNAISGSTLEALTVQSLMETCKTWTNLRVEFYEMHEVPHEWAEGEANPQDDMQRKSFIRFRRFIFRFAEVTHTILSLTHFGALWREEDLDVHHNGNVSLVATLMIDFLVMFSMCKFIARNDTMNYLFAPLFLISAPPSLFTQFKSMMLPYYTFRIGQLAVMLLLLIWKHGSAHLMTRICEDVVFAWALFVATVIFFLLLPFEMTLSCGQGDIHDYAPLTTKDPETIDDSLLKMAMENDDVTLVRLLARVQQMPDPSELLQIGHRQKSTKAFKALCETKSYQDRLLLGHKSGVTAVAAFPDGKTLVSGGNDGICILWDLDTSAILTEWTEHAGQNLWFVDASVSGMYALAGGDDEKVRMYEVRSRQLHKEVECGNTWGGKIFPDDQRIIVQKNSGYFVWDLATMENLYHLKTGSGHCVPLLSADGKFIARSFAAHDEIFDTTNGQKLDQRVDQQDERAEFWGFCPDGGKLCMKYGSSNKGLHILGGMDNATSQRHTAACLKTPSYMHNGAFFPDGSGCVSAESQREAVKVALFSREMPLELVGSNTDIWCVDAFLSAGKPCVVAAFDDGSIRVWEVRMEA